MTMHSFGGAMPLPKWLPDETLFSLLSRYHFLSGNRSFATTTHSLFSHRSSGSEHDFPSRLAELTTHTRQALGSAVDLCLDRTILPFYLPLQDIIAAAAAVASLVEGPQGMLKYRLGILTSRFRANHPARRLFTWRKPSTVLIGNSLHPSGSFWQLSWPVGNLVLSDQLMLVSRSVD